MDIHDQTCIVHYNHRMPEQTHKIISHRSLPYIWRHTVNTLEPGMCEGLGWGLERGYSVEWSSTNTNTHYATILCCVSTM